VGAYNCPVNKVEGVEEDSDGEEEDACSEDLLGELGLLGDGADVEEDGRVEGEDYAGLEVRGPPYVVVVRAADALEGLEEHQPQQHPRVHKHPKGSVTG
jgi:hypothetical protein